MGFIDIIHSVLVFISHVQCTVWFLSHVQCTVWFNVWQNSSRCQTPRMTDCDWQVYSSSQH